MSKHLVVYFVGCVVFGYAIFSLVRIMQSLAPDFSVFYDASQGLLSGKNIYTLPMYTGLGYPPFSLLPFLPFTRFSYPAAQAFWIGLSFIFFLSDIYLSLSLVETRVRFREWCLVFIFGFLAFPVKFTLGMGQGNFLALLLLLLSLWGWQKKQTWLSGLSYGLLLIVKPHFILLVPVYFLSGQWFATAISFSVIFLSAMTTGLLFGWGQYVFYFNKTVPPLLVFSGRTIYYNQSLGSFLGRLFPLPLAAELTQWASIILSVGALWFIWRKRLGLLEAIIVSLPIFLLVEPLSWQHHYVFLLPVFVWLAVKVKQNIRLLIVLGICYFLVALNIRNPELWRPLALSALILSHVCIGNMLIIGLTIRQLGRRV